MFGSGLLPIKTTLELPPAIQNAARLVIVVSIGEYFGTPIITQELDKISKAKLFQDKIKKKIINFV